MQDENMIARIARILGMDKDRVRTILNKTPIDITGEFSNDVFVTWAEKARAKNLQEHWDKCTIDEVQEVYERAPCDCATEKLALQHWIRLCTKPTEARKIFLLLHGNRRAKLALQKWIDLCDTQDEIIAVHEAITDDDPMVENLAHRLAVILS